MTNASSAARTASSTERWHDVGSIAPGSAMTRRLRLPRPDASASSSDPIATVALTRIAKEETMLRMRDVRAEESYVLSNYYSRLNILSSRDMSSV